MSDADLGDGEEFLSNDDVLELLLLASNLFTAGEEILSAVEENTVSAINENTLYAVEESTLSTIEKSTLEEETSLTFIDAAGRYKITLSTVVENTLSVVEEGTSSILEGQLLSVDQVASVIVTIETETSAPQGQSRGHHAAHQQKKVCHLLHFMLFSVCFIAFKPTSFICSLHKLLELAAGVCDVGNCRSQHNVDYCPSGCCVSIFGTCTKGHPFHWESSDRIGTEDQRKLHIDNLHFAAAVVLSGNNYSKMELFARFYQLNILCSASFYENQRNYVSLGVDKFTSINRYLVFGFFSKQLI